MSNTPEKLRRHADFVNQETSTVYKGEKHGLRQESAKMKKASETAVQVEKAQKRTSEEMMSQGYTASNSLGAAYAPVYPRSAHPLLAPRSYFMPDQFDAPVEGFPLGGYGVAQVSASLGTSDRFSSLDEEQPSAEAFARMSRSERKRFREKKRRSQVNKGFDDLWALLLKVEYVST